MAFDLDDDELKATRRLYGLDKERGVKNMDKKCDKCKYFYDLCDTSEFCTVCSQGVCYMCMRNGETCNLFEEGDVPKGKKRGE